MTELETERLRLEPLTRLHAAELFQPLSDPRVFEFIPHDPPPSFEAFEARYARLEGRQSPAGDERWLNWAIRSKAAGVCLGRVEATLRQDGTAYLAYEVGPAHWGQGYATEACRRVIDALFDDYAAERVIGEVDTRNAASIRLLERLGFERVSLKPGADFFKGAPSDEFTYSLGRGR